VLLQGLSVHISCSAQSDGENPGKTQHTFTRIFYNNKSSFEIYAIEHGTEMCQTEKINIGSAL
jgi:hypothetical protein